MSLNTKQQELSNKLLSLNRDVDKTRKELVEIENKIRLKHIQDGKTEFSNKFDKYLKEKKIKLYDGGDSTEDELKNIIISFVTLYKYDMRLTKEELLSFLDFWNDVLYL